MNGKEVEQFMKIVDSFIKQLNELDHIAESRKSAIIMHAAARYNMYAMYSDHKTKEETIDYLVDQYKTHCIEQYDEMKEYFKSLE